MENSRADSRALSAKYYDEAYASGEELPDLSFYLDLARRVGGPVLELGCGTGRVLLEIARAGIAVDGVDSSESMLDRLRQKLAGEAASLGERVSVFAGDMRSFRSQRKYALVILPFRPLQHMHTVQDQLAALRTAAFHLQDGGFLAFDVYYPRLERVNAGLNEEVLEMEWRPRDHPDALIRRYVRKDSHDKDHADFQLHIYFSRLAWRKAGP